MAIVKRVVRALKPVEEVELMNLSYKFLSL